MGLLEQFPFEDGIQFVDQFCLLHKRKRRVNFMVIPQITFYSICKIVLNLKTFAYFVRYCELGLQSLVS